MELDRFFSPRENKSSFLQKLLRNVFPKVSYPNIATFYYKKTQWRPIFRGGDWPHFFLRTDCGGNASDSHYPVPTIVFGKLLLLFILVPLAELYLFMTLGAQLGFPSTIAIIIITAIIGATLTKSQGRLAMAKFQQATSEGRMPHKEALDGLMILLAGAVLLTPGFLTDAIGFLLLIPPIRAVVRNSLAKRLKGKIKVVTPGFPPQAEEESGPPSKLDDGKVIDV